ncbi:hypothetical protein [Nocardia asiatica]|uniref:hypothetical protein n=1 Tax=Nocardia asiatica TaxID=209252 RepID=UPI000687C2EF|nr:hypothetical protein [Nocardia asiatica]
MTLTQPWATVLTGVFAVTAAAIAYRGVLANLREARKAEHRKAASEVLLSAAATLHEAKQLSAGPFLPVTSVDSEPLRIERYRRLSAEAGKLRLFGFEMAALHLDKVATDARFGSTSNSWDDDNVRDTEEAMKDALKSLYK